MIQPGADQGHKKTQKTKGGQGDDRRHGLGPHRGVGPIESCEQSGQLETQHRHHGQTKPTQQRREAPDGSASNLR